MLRVTVELLPFGSKKLKRELARMDIINTGDHPDDPIQGNYHASLVTHLPNGDVRASKRVILDFDRLRWNVWGIVYAVLVALGESGMEGNDDTHSITEGT